MAGWPMLETEKNNSRLKRDALLGDGEGRGVRGDLLWPSGAPAEQHLSSSSGHGLTPLVLERASSQPDAE